MNTEYVLIILFGITRSLENPLEQLIELKNCKVKDKNQWNITDKTISIRESGNSNNAK